MKTDQLLNYELAERIKQGEATAFELLFKLYYKPLINYAMLYLHNSELSSEIIQETFIKIWESRSSIDSEKSLKSFLYRCTHNNCVNFIKKSQYNSRLSEEYKAEILTSIELWEENFTDHLFEMMADEQRISSLHNAIDDLPQQCREIFILCRFENYSYNQIAEKLNISVNTVKTQLQRAMAKIKEAVKKSYHGGTEAIVR